MSTPTPSAKSVAVYRQWSKAVEDLQALESKMDGDRFLAHWNRQPPPAPSKEQLDLKAKLEKTIAELEPIVMRDFPA